MMPTLSERIRNVVEHTSAFQWLTEWADEAARLEANQVPEGLVVETCPNCNGDGAPTWGCIYCQGTGKRLVKRDA